MSTQWHLHHGGEPAEFETATYHHQTEAYIYRKLSVVGGVKSAHNLNIGGGGKTYSGHPNFFIWGAMAPRPPFPTPPPNVCCQYPTTENKAGGRGSGHYWVNRGYICMLLCKWTIMTRPKPRITCVRSIWLFIV